MKELVEVIAKSISRRSGQRCSFVRDRTAELRLLKYRVADSDMGKGHRKTGRIAKAIRSVVKSSSGKGR